MKGKTLSVALTAALVVSLLAVALFSQATAVSATNTNFRGGTDRQAS